MTSTDPQQPSTTTPDPAQTDVPAPQETAPADAAVAGPGDDAVVASTTARAGSSVTGGEDAVPVTAVVDPRTVRRAPRFKAFAWTGVVVGLIVSAVLNLFALEPGHPTWSRSILTLEVTLAALVVGVVWALVADRRSRR